MVNCAVTNCNNRSGRKCAKQMCVEAGSKRVTFHRFPKCEAMRKIWLTNVGLTEAMLPSTPVLCSAHFQEEAFDRRSVNRVHLKPNSIPYAHTMEVSDGNNEIEVESTSKEFSKEVCVSSSSSYLYEVDQQEMSLNVSNKETFSLKRNRFDEEEIKTDCESDVQHNQTKSISVSPKRVKVDKATLVSPKLHFNTPRKNKLREMLKEQAQQHSKTVSVLKQKVQRQEKKFASVIEILHTLQEKYLDEHQVDILKDISSSNADFLKRVIKKCKKKTVSRIYSPELRRFALTLHYYSPKAYNYVRNYFNSCLPHVTTLSRWYQSINGDPGFCSEALETIKKRAKNTPYTLVGTLMFDEMSIRQHIEYDGKQFCGYTDMGTNIESDKECVAKDVLVFLFVCMNGAWKIPIGYFLINGINAEQKRNLVLQALTMLHEASIKVKCLTFDGAPTNIAMAKLLQSNLLNLDMLQTWFLHPVTKEKVFIFLDPCHLMKLIRNAFGDIKWFSNEHGEHISWRFIQLLHELQEKEGLHLGNKLRQTHINYHLQKMKVRFAAQVFSKSVADALKVCEKDLQLQEFQNSSATSQFLNIFNDLFDIFNSKNLRTIGFKKAINLENSTVIIQKLNECKAYILGLKITDGKLVIQSRRKMGFLGFILDIESLKELFHDMCVDSTELKYIPTYKISQDHLELYFGCIRLCGGSNNNPTARQFKSAFKKTLVHSELRSSNGNCIELEKISILHVTAKKSPSQIINCSTPAMKMLNYTVNESTIINDHSYYPDIRVVSEFSERIVAYIAGFVIRKLKASIYCETCIAALYGDHDCLRNGLIKQKTRGALIYPSQDTFKICRLAENVIKQALYESGGKFMMKRFNGDYLLNAVLFDIKDNRTIFDNLVQHSNDQSPFENHRIHLCKAVAQKYIKIRLFYVGLRSNDSAKSERHKLNKLIIFKGM